MRARLGETPSEGTHRMAGLASACLLFSVYGFSITVSPGSGLPHITQQNPVVVFVSCLMILISVLSLVLLFLLPTRQMKVLHAVPCTPFVPLTSIFTNIYLLANLSWWTWARFAAWMFIGKCSVVSRCNYFVLNNQVDENLKLPSQKWTVCMLNTSQFC